MIPDSPCDRVFAVRGGNSLASWVARTTSAGMTDDNKRPWMTYVDEDVLRKKSGDGRRFSSDGAAYAAACKAAPKKRHP